MARLPQVNGDNDQWGSILNDFLSQSLNTDGTLKTAAVGTGLPTSVANAASRVVDVRDYTAGNTDTQAFQAAFNAAAAIAGSTSGGVKVVIPYRGPLAPWQIASTITVQPIVPATRVRIDVECSCPWDGIQWTGGSGADSSHMLNVFKTWGLKTSTWNGLQVMIPNVSNVCVFDMDVDATRNSSGLNTFINVGASTNGAVTNCVGWRMGHTGGATGGTEMSFDHWIDCSVYFGGGVQTGSAGCIGFANEHPNGKNFTFTMCAPSGCAIGFTNNSTPGAAAAAGGADMHFRACGGSYTGTSYDFRSSGVYGIVGGRWELGGQFLAVGGGGGGQQANGVTIPVSGVICQAFNLSAGQVSNNRMIDTAMAGSIIVSGSEFTGGINDNSTGFGTAFGNASCDPSSYGTMIFDGCLIQASYQGPINVLHGRWEIRFRGTAVCDVDGRANITHGKMGTLYAGGTQPIGQGTETVQADATGGAQTLTLPPANVIAEGFLVTVSDYRGSAVAGNITIAPSGTDTINGANASRVINANFGVLRLRCVTGTGVTGWVVDP